MASCTKPQDLSPPLCHRDPEAQAPPAPQLVLASHSGSHVAQRQAQTSIRTRMRAPSVSSEKPLPSLSPLTLLILPVPQHPASQKGRWWALVCPEGHHLQRGPKTIAGTTWARPSQEVCKEPEWEGLCLSVEGIPPPDLALQPFFRPAASPTSKPCRAQQG